MRKLIASAVVLAVMQGGGAASAQAKAVAVECPSRVAGVKFYRSMTWHRQRVIGVHKQRSVFNAWRVRSCRYTLWVAKLWQRRAHQFRTLYENPPHKAQWNCIHGYEGGWDANTGNGYYGGLQMDISFQRHYGAWLLRTKGTANHWSPLEQMWVAERAHRSGRGFFPWPNTARYCGLI